MPSRPAISRGSAWHCGTPRWFDEHMPFEIGLGHPLEYAIY
ncbi:hypothetical protein [Mesorhizobium sp. C089B]|nr:hypothetical protein [Mesorhizobium sp. C089B]